METIQITQMSSESLITLIRTELTSLLQDFVLKPVEKQTDENYLTKKQVCELLNISATTLWRWVNGGKITAHGIGSKRYFKRSELLESITSLEITSPIGVREIYHNLKNVA